MSIVFAAIEHIGLSKVANAAGVTPAAATKWRDGGLPQTELVGTTNYAVLIEDLSGGKYTASSILAETRRRWLSRGHVKRGAKRKRVGG